MDPLLIKLATFVGAALAVVGGVSIFTDVLLRERSRIKERMREEFHDAARRKAQRSELFKDLKTMRADTAGLIPRAWRQFLVLVEQSGLDIAPIRIIQIALTAGVVGGVLGGALTRLWFIGAGCAVIGLVAPFLYVHAARNARMHQLCMQLPEAFDMMSRAIRAGQTMAGAMHLAATQLKPPISLEFASCCEQQNLGLPPDVALEELARRTGVVELQMFVLAMLVHRSAGGNLTEILDNLSDVIRKRTRLRGKVKAATSEGRLQALVLSLMPLGALGALIVLNRPYAQILLDRPTLLVGILASEAIGAFWIRRIVNFRF